VLEIGCGTARNLMLAARHYPDARLFGIDISAEMLKSAEATISKNRIGDRVRLAQGDATRFDACNLFGVAQFDRVFFSYSLSMIPGWEAALDQAIQAVAPGGELHVVDFGQQAALPGWFGKALKAWLARFHVTPRANLGDAMSRHRAGPSRGAHLVQAALPRLRPDRCHPPALNTPPVEPQPAPPTSNFGHTATDFRIAKQAARWAQARAPGPTAG
jgi:S-adenosylmethionine-diacylgycerolhomoserine-N-methlytransferase